MRHFVRLRQDNSGIGYGLRRPRWRNPILCIYGNALIMLLPLVALTIMLGRPSATVVDWYNAIGPGYLMVVTAYAAYRVARTLPAALWSPAFWLLASSAVFFGFGPLVAVFGNEGTQVRLSVGNLAISEVELFQSNRLSLIGVFALILGFWLHARIRRAEWLAALTGSQNRKQVAFNPETLTVAFVVGGMILVHVIIMPSQWGQLDIVVPGALTSIASIVNVGFAIAASLAVRGSKRMVWLLVLLWPLHLLLTVLSFAKSALMIALLLPAIGAYLGHRRMVRLAVAALVIGGVYTLSQDFVHYGRSEIMQGTGTIWQAGYGERMRITRDYFTGGPDTAASFRTLDEEQGWWLRLNYSAVQAMAIRFRDQGVVIDTLSNVWTMFIPRILWPGKPIYVGPGAQFYTLITGNRGTNVGVSLFGDVYWQFGWLGIMTIIPLIGWMFAMLSWRSIETVLQLNLIRMPLVLLSILMPAQGLTMWLANGIIAVIPIYIAYLLLIILVERFVRSQRRRRAGAPSGFPPMSKTRPGPSV